MEVVVPVLAAEKIHSTGFHYIEKEAYLMYEQYWVSRQLKFKDHVNVILNLFSTWMSNFLCNSTI